MLWVGLNNFQGSGFRVAGPLSEALRAFSGCNV